MWEFWGHGNSGVRPRYSSNGNSGVMEFWGQTPIFLQEGFDDDTMREAVNGILGSDPDIPEFWGQTPIFLIGNSGVIGILGSDPDIPNRDNKNCGNKNWGQTPRIKTGVRPRYSYD